MDSTSSTQPKVDVYSIVNNRIIELLEQDTVPWQKPWHDSGIPMNLVSKRPYRGINLWLLLSLDYTQNLFLTWEQLKKIGGSVKQGEHGHVVVYWKTPQKKENTSEIKDRKQVPLLRYYKVFNVAQCKDLPEELVMPFVEKEHDPILECETIISQMPQAPEIKYKVQKAFYDIEGDFINMPKKKNFKSIEGYYATLFHELVHSTGSEKRLNRKTITEMAEFADDLYSMEELIAELGSAYLYSFAGIATPLLPNSASYIKGWVTQLKNDKRFIIHASGQAQKAVDFICSQYTPELQKKLTTGQS
jgi:antirestriction protein ArdC